ncbi:MAG: hypothetical protein AMS27_10710 [Bacteroides sp. SM23_62_1]|nr:MAG: hypothetical protein AMS27_10710 [Bacteroides sp. SM23_62_1]
MHKEILSDQQIKLLPLISEFSKEYYLVGGTAVALHIGHRQSIDFDLFTEYPIKRKQIRNIIERMGWQPDRIIYEAYDQMHLIIRDIKITFFQYPHTIHAELKFDNIINMPELIDLAAMKAYALGGRAKWKDYVDLYFLLKDHFSFREISDRATKLFKGYYNEKLFKEQLSWFKDIDYSESITYLVKEPEEEEIKLFLQDIATQAF